MRSRCGPKGTRWPRSRPGPAGRSERSSGCCRTPGRGWLSSWRRGEVSAAPASDRVVEVDGFVAAFEAARRRDATADPAAFLPAPAHPLYREVLLELVRVDLEFNWAE